MEGRAGVAGGWPGHFRRLLRDFNAGTGTPRLQDLVSQELELRRANHPRATCSTG